MWRYRFSTNHEPAFSRFSWLSVQDAFGVFAVYFTKLRLLIPSKCVKFMFIFADLTSNGYENGLLFSQHRGRLRNRSRSAFMQVHSVMRREINLILNLFGLQVFHQINLKTVGNTPKISIWSYYSHGLDSKTEERVIHSHRSACCRFCQLYISKKGIQAWFKKDEGLEDWEIFIWDIWSKL